MYVLHPPSLSLTLIPPASINIAAALADIIIIIVDPRIFMVGVVAVAASLAVPHISISCLVSLGREIGRRSLTFKAAANSKSSLHLGDTVERNGPQPPLPQSQSCMAPPLIMGGPHSRCRPSFVVRFVC